MQIINWKKFVEFLAHSFHFLGTVKNKTSLFNTPERRASSMQRNWGGGGGGRGERYSPRQGRSFVHLLPLLPESQDGNYLNS